MHARVTRTKMKPGQMEEAIRISRDSILPVAKSQRGFKGYLVLSDPASGDGVTVTFWETQADMAANEKSEYYRAQLAKVGSTLAEPPTTEHYEVAIQV